jgi:hypothetical protein
VPSLPTQATSRGVIELDDATGPPSADDDRDTVGVTVGSLWIDRVNHRVWLCEDATTGAAVWTELTGG